MPERKVGAGEGWPGAGEGWPWAGRMGARSCPCPRTHSPQRCQPALIEVSMGQLVCNGQKQPSRARETWPMGQSLLQALLSLIPKQTQSERNTSPGEVFQVLSKHCSLRWFCEITVKCTVLHAALLLLLPMRQAPCHRTQGTWLLNTKVPTRNRL